MLSIKNILKQIIFLFVISISFFIVSPSSAFAQTFNFNFSAVPGTSNGTVTLFWTDVDYVESYNIAYGTAPGSYSYGVTNVGDINTYTIGGLTPGQTYYFVLSPVDDGKAMAFTNEVHAVAAGAQTAQTPTKSTAMTPTQPAIGSATVPTTTQTPPAATTNKFANEGPQPLAGNDEDKNFHVTAMSGQSKGTVTLRWDNKGYIDNYNIAYGAEPGKYIWGAANIGKVGEFTVGGLNPGQRYYFVLSPVDDKTALSYSPYVSAIATK